MVSDDLQVWLIEVNSSPDCSYSTSTTKQLVKTMLPDMMKVVIDAEKFGVQPHRPKRKWDKLKVDTGRFELLEPERRRREEKFGKLRKSKGAGTLTIQGSPIAPCKPLKTRGDCPSGPEASAGPLVQDAAAVWDALEAEAQAEGGPCGGTG